MRHGATINCLTILVWKSFFFFFLESHLISNNLSWIYARSILRAIILSSNQGSFKANYTLLKLLIGTANKDAFHIHTWYDKKYIYIISNSRLRKQLLSGKRASTFFLLLNVYCSFWEFFDNTAWLRTGIFTGLIADLLKIWLQMATYIMLCNTTL